jgi:hypothetical protein
MVRSNAPYMLIFVHSLGRRVPSFACIPATVFVIIMVEKRIGKTKKQRDLQFAQYLEAIRYDYRRNHKQALGVFFMAVSQAMGKMGISGDSNSSISYNHTQGKSIPKIDGG